MAQQVKDFLSHSCGSAHYCAIVQDQSLAQELPHAVSMAEKKKKKKKKKKSERERERNSKFKSSPAMQSFSFQSNTTV